MAFDLVQTSFAGGELSPRMHGRVDSELYKKGLGLCENFSPQALGSTIMRGGSGLVAQPAGAVRTIEFPVYDSEPYDVVLGGGLLRVFDDGGQAVSAGYIEALRNGAFTYGWSYWEKKDAVSQNGKTYLSATIIPAQGGIGIIPGWIKQSFPVTAGQYTLLVRAAVPAKLKLTVKIGTSLDAADVADFSLVGSGAASLDAVQEARVQYSVGSDVTLYMAVSYMAATPDVFGAAFHTAMATLADGTKVGAYVQALGFQLATAGYQPVEFSIPWADADLRKVQRVADTRRDRMFFFSEKATPHELVYERATGGWLFGPATLAPPNGTAWPWPEGCFPAAGELYQGRLWLAGVPGLSNTFWASKSGDPYTFTEGSSSEMGFSLDVSTKGGILWLQGHRTLLVGTDRGEYSITAQGGVVRPSDFQVRPESAFGSAPVQALSIGDQVLYLSPDRRKVRTLSYNLQENGYQSFDITLPADHITANLVEEVAWAASCDTLVALLRDGTLAACVYNKGAQVAAWHRFALPRGEVLSIDVSNGPAGSVLWLLVQRASGVCLERIRLQDVGPYLDSFVTRPVEAKVVAGLSHLEGETVGVVLDSGVVHPPLTVTAGAVTLSVDASSVTVGLPYRAKARLLPLGKALAGKSRRVRFGLMLNDSGLPLVNGERPFSDRTPTTPMDKPEGRVTGKVQTNLLGWEESGVVTIEQDQPIRTEILAVFGTAAANEA